MAFDDLDRAEQSESDRSDSADDGAAQSGSGSVRTYPDESSDESGSPDRGEPGAHSGSDTDVDSGAADAGSGGATPSDPAFGFEAAKQRPLYARQGAWEAFEDALAIEVEATLRGNDVRDAPKRELHDAALRVLADHADEVANRVLEARDVDR